MNRKKEQIERQRSREASRKIVKARSQKEHLTWIEVNSILGQLASRAAATLAYLPPEHPESFCQSLSVAGMALERLANQAADLLKNPPTARHNHER